MAQTSYTLGEDRPSSISENPLVFESASLSIEGIRTPLSMITISPEYGHDINTEHLLVLVALGMRTARTELPTSWKLN